MSTPAAPPERCARCNAPLSKNRDGHITYWSVMTPGPQGWPLSVKVCLDCKQSILHPPPPVPPGPAPVWEMDLEYVYPPGATGILV